MSVLSLENLLKYHSWSASGACQLHENYFFTDT